MGPERIDSTEKLLFIHDDLCEQGRNLIKVKNHDYAMGQGTSDPFANFRAHGLLGIHVRMSDKMARLLTYIKAGELKVQDENIKDTLVDLINYAVLAYGFILDERAKSNEGKVK